MTEAVTESVTSNGFGTLSSQGPSFDHPLDVRFSLTNVLWILVLLAVGIGWRYDHEKSAAKVSEQDRQRRAIGALQLRASIPVDEHGTPIRVNFAPHACADEDLAYLQDLPTLREVSLAYCHQISDRGIQNLYHLPELKILCLYRNKH